MPVRTLASLIEMGERREVLRRDYPHIPEEAYVVAVPWAHANPSRGRPALTRQDERNRARRQPRRVIDANARRLTGTWPRGAIKRLHDE